MGTLHARKNYKKFREEKERVSREEYGGTCYLCGNGEGFEQYHLHHREYHPDDSSYKRDSKAMWTRWLRVKEAAEHPERFNLLCPSCHRLVTSVGNYLLDRLSVMPQVDVDKFLELIILEFINRREEGSRGPDTD